MIFNSSNIQFLAENARTALAAINGQRSSLEVQKTSLSSTIGGHSSLAPKTATDLQFQISTIDSQKKSLTSQGNQLQDQLSFLTSWSDQSKQTDLDQKKGQPPFGLPQGSF